MQRGTFNDGRFRIWTTDATSDTLTEEGGESGNHCPNFDTGIEEESSALEQPHDEEIHNEENTQPSQDDDGCDSDGNSEDAESSTESLRERPVRTGLEIMWLIC